MPGKMGWLASALMDEVLDVLAEEVDPNEMVPYLLLTSQIIRWCATGDPTDIPEEFRDKVNELLPDYMQRPLAIES
jgi:hypothetical protein